VAVPTQFHLDYARMLHNQRIRFAMEKPVVFSEVELSLIREHGMSELFSNSFVMSYYWLEKSLPVNYFLTLNPRIRSLIETDWEPWTISLLHKQLGALRNIAISFEEPGETERRVWTEVKESGGMVGETLIHPLTLVMQLAHHELGVEQCLWKFGPELRWFRNAERARQHPKISATSVELTGELSSHVRVFIRCGKYYAHKRRCALVEYENGYLTLDLDEQVLRIFTRATSGPAELRLAMRTTRSQRSNMFGADGQRLLDALSATSPYAGLTPAEQLRKKRGTDITPFGRILPYQLQLDLVNTFFIKGWCDQRFDDFSMQFWVIEELLQIARQLPDDDQVTQIDVDPLLHAADAEAHPLIEDCHLIAPNEYRYPSHFLLSRARAYPSSSP
jgi:hypothetical protein